MTEKTKKAEKRIEASPFDTEAWSILIRDAQVMVVLLSQLIFTLKSLSYLVVLMSTCI